MNHVKILHLRSILPVALLCLILFSSCEKEELPTPRHATADTETLEDIDEGYLSVDQLQLVLGSEELVGALPNSDSLSTSEDKNIGLRSWRENIAVRTKSVVTYPATWLATSAVVQVTDHCGKTRTVYYGGNGTTVKLGPRNISGGRFYVKSNFRSYSVPMPPEGANSARVFRTSRGVLVAFYAEVTNLRVIGGHVQEGPYFYYYYRNSRSETRTYVTTSGLSTVHTIKLERGRSTFTMKGHRTGTITVRIPSSATVAKIYHSSNGKAIIYFYTGSMINHRC